MSTLDTAATLARIARTLRADIGPAVAQEYPKTQAFMAAVVLQKLASQLQLQAAHADAERRDIAALTHDLRAARHEAPLPPGVATALDALERAPGKPALCTLVEALYAARGDLGDARFGALLGRVRTTLRAGIDRELAFSA